MPFPLFFYSLFFSQIEENTEKDQQKTPSSAQIACRFFHCQMMRFSLKLWAVK